MTAVWPVVTLEDDEYWSWQLRGSCLDSPSDLFFPESEPRRDRRRREEQAKSVCRDCPVLARCREHAVSTPERYGIWGATTPRERGIRPSHGRAEKNSR
jgi:WhiB family redox-sensing transcriptional regulator